MGAVVDRVYGEIYDATAWMSVSVISEASVAAGGMPQAIPDFTCGMWARRPPADVIAWN